MSRPRKVDIGPFRYEVAWLPDLPQESGFTNSDQRLFGIALSTSEQTQRETLLHEVLHGIIDLTSLRGQEKDVEEKIVASISPVLFQVIRSNPTLVSFLTESR